MQNLNLAQVNWLQIFLKVLYYEKFNLSLFSNNKNKNLELAERSELRLNPL